MSEQTAPLPARRRKKRWLTIAAVVAATALDVLARTDIVPTLLLEAAHGLRDVARPGEQLPPEKSES